MNLDQFINDQIESIDQLRALLLLQATPDHEWDVVAVCGKLHLLPEVAEAVLTSLAAKGLVVSGGEPRRFRYQTRSAELASLVAELATLDRERPVTLINKIYARPKQIQAFADAFKLRKENEK